MIIHAAAVTHSRDETDYFEVNFQGTVNLVNAAGWNPDLRFVFISSRTAGAHGGAYAESKLRAEKYIKQHLGNWTIVQPAEIYGSSKRDGIDKLMEDVLSKRVIPCPVGLSSKLYPIHIDDAVNIMYDLVFRGSQLGQTFVVNGSEGFSYYELARYLRDRTVRWTWLVPIPRFAMFSLKRVVEWFGLPAGIAPDQIPRLYGPKPVQDLGYEVPRLADHLARGRRSVAGGQTHRQIHD